MSSDNLSSQTGPAALAEQPEPDPTGSPAERPTVRLQIRTLSRGTGPGRKEPLADLDLAALESRREQLLKDWSEILSGRARWSATKRDRVPQGIEERAAATMEAGGFGLTAEQVAGIAMADTIELCFVVDRPKREDRPKGFPWDRWLTFPWEFVISRATAPKRGSRYPLLVVRRRAYAGATEPASWWRGQKLFASSSPRSPALLFVKSNPGPLAAKVEFKDEEKLIRSAIEDPKTFVLCETPTLERLKDQVRVAAPEIVHITGLDTVQASEHWKEVASEFGLLNEGVFLEDAHDPGRKAVLPSALEFAEHIALSADNPPRLVSCNFFRSAASVALELLDAGVDHCVAIHDEESDFVMDEFLAYFYRAWSQTGGDTLAAFRWAQTKTFHNRPRQQEGSVVLWSRWPLLEKTDLETLNERSTKLQEAEQKELELKSGEADKILTVHVEPRLRVNHAMLHNSKELFAEFRILKFRPGRLGNLRVEVQLHHGSETVRFAKRFGMARPIIDLSGKIRIHLAPPIANQIHDAIQSSLEVRVLAGDEEVYCDTHHLMVQPYQDWLQNDEHLSLLPSLVLPSEPAILDILKDAHGFLRAIASVRPNDPVSFDGMRDDLSHQDAPGHIELRVRAIWYTIQERRSLRYARSSTTADRRVQRVRTPTTILNQRQGTCLDLALLFAACLEGAGLRPVLLLFRGHAMVGFWTSWRSYDRFLRGEDGGTATGQPGRSTNWSWMLTHTQLEEIREHVTQKRLAVLEVISLTRDDTLQEASEQGQDFLLADTGTQLQILLDIGLARDENVRPLPIKYAQ